MAINIYKNIKIGLITLAILINIILYHLLPPALSKRIYLVVNEIAVFLLNVKVTLHGNTDLLQKKNILIMSNHYDGMLDSNIIYNLYYKNNSNTMLHTVVKADIVGDAADKSLLLNLMAYVKNAFITSSYLIPYKRGDKEDGKVVKETIADYLQNNKNVLIYPEGTTRKNGVPKDFKHGIFQLAVEKKASILPITLKFARDCGTEKGEPANFYDLFDNEVDVYLHDLIDSETDDCYKTNDFMALKQKTFERITGGHPPTPARM
jgi:1-acyl-sn-glycerol-3-phosphate acyltransferase